MIVVTKQKLKQAVAKKTAIFGNVRISALFREGQTWDIRVVPSEDNECYRLSRDCMSIGITPEEFNEYFVECEG